MSSYWYVLYVRSNCEAKASSLIRDNLRKHDKLNLLKDLKIPSQKTSLVKRGKRVEVDKRLYPGYIILCIEKNESFELVRNIITNTEYIKKFLGHNGKPVPISKEEANRLLQQVEKGKNVQENQVEFAIGDQVEVREGGFNGLPGTIEAIDKKTRIVKISVTIFGRSTTIELPIRHIVLVQ